MLSIFEQWCEPGIGAPIHWHRVEEALTVLSVEAEIWIDVEQVQAGTGHYLQVQRSGPLLMRHCRYPAVRIPLAEVLVDAMHGVL